MANLELHYTNSQRNWHWEKGTKKVSDLTHADIVAELVDVGIVVCLIDKNNTRFVATGKIFPGGINCQIAPVGKYSISSLRGILVGSTYKRWDKKTHSSFRNLGLAKINSGLLSSAAHSVSSRLTYGSIEIGNQASMFSVHATPDFTTTNRYFYSYIDASDIPTILSNTTTLQDTAREVTIYTNLVMSIARPQLQLYVQLLEDFPILKRWRPGLNRS